MASDQILQHILRTYGLTETYLALSRDMSGTDLTSFLMDVFKARALHVSPADVMHQFASDRFVLPSEVPQSTLVKFDGAAFDLLPGWEHIELSPLAPFATSSGIAPVDQRNVINSARMHDIVSDCSNVLALIAAGRRKAQEADIIRLCTSHRLVRQQNYTEPGYTAHFRVFCLASAGRARGSYGFETDCLVEHANFYIQLLRSFPQSAQQALRLNLRQFQQTSADWSTLESTMNSLGVALSYEHPARENWSYYLPFQFQIFIGQGAQAFPLIDGGCVDWTSLLLSDRKERLLISAIGTEVFCKTYL